MPTKTAKAVAKSVRKPVAKAAPAPVKKKAPAPVEAPAESKRDEGRRIQSAMTATLMNADQIAAKVGLSVARIQAHLAWEMKCGRSKLDSKNRVVVLSQPKYRTE